MHESRFPLIDENVHPDDATMRRFRTYNGWRRVRAEMERSLRIMQGRAESWNAEFHDDASRCDLAELRVLLARVEGLALADPKAVAPRLFAHRLSLSVQRMFDEDLRVYRDRAATAESFFSLFRCAFAQYSSSGI